MGKITGILEFERSDRHYQPVEERIKHWREFVLPLPEEDNKKQAARCMDCAKAPVELTKSETDQVAGGAPTGDPGNAYGAGRGWGHDGLGGVGGGNGRGWLKSNDNGRPSP